MKLLFFFTIQILLSSFLFSQPNSSNLNSSNVYKIESGFVDANGVMIYYEEFGKGKPLMIVHGGPGATHDYFLPYLLPLAKQNKLIFIDERGSGKSGILDDVKQYTVENMVEDVEAVRQALGLGKISLARPFIWRSTCTSLRFKVSEKFNSLNFMQHFPQHKTNE